MMQHRAQQAALQQQHAGNLDVSKSHEGYHNNGEGGYHDGMTHDEHDSALRRRLPWENFVVADQQQQQQQQQHQQAGANNNEGIEPAQAMWPQHQPVRGGGRGDQQVNVEGPEITDQAMWGTVPVPNPRGGRTSSIVSRNSHRSALSPKNQQQGFLSVPAMSNFTPGHHSTFPSHGTEPTVDGSAHDEDGGQQQRDGDEDDEGEAGGGSDRRRVRKSWAERLSELRQFRAEHGHLDVPARHPALGRFLINQRQQYRFLREGKKSSLSAEQIVDLESLGFHWTSSVGGGGGRGRPNQRGWEYRLNKLAEFSREHGHTRVPQPTKRMKEEDPDLYSLGKWVDNQRQQYSARHRGKWSAMSDERIASLEALGFEWNPRRRRPAPGVRAEQRRKVQIELLDELRSRKELSTSQVADLDALRDKWTSAAKGKKESKFNQKSRWNERLDMLKEYKARHGHTRVPQPGKKMKKDDPKMFTLGKWVDNQRQQYSLRQRGKRHAMGDDRVKALEEIGFVWHVNRRRDEKENAGKDDSDDAVKVKQEEDPSKKGKKKKSKKKLQVGASSSSTPSADNNKKKKIKDTEYLVVYEPPECIKSSENNTVDATNDMPPNCENSSRDDKPEKCDNKAKLKPCDDDDHPEVEACCKAELESGGVDKGSDALECDEAQLDCESTNDEAASTEPV